MFILIVARDFPKPDSPLRGIFEFDQAKALVRHGHKVIYVSLDMRSIFRKRPLGIYEVITDGIKVYNASIPLGRVPKKVINFLGRIALHRIYRKVCAQYGTPDVVHAHFISSATIASSLKKKFNIPFVVTEHSSHINKDFLEASLIDRYRKTYQLTDKLIVVSRALEDKIKAHFGISTVVIPNIVDTDTFRFSQRERKDTFSFISVGRLVKNKGFDLLVDAFKEADFGRHVTLHIVGTGPMHTELVQKIKTLGMCANVFLHGRLNRTSTAQLMMNSDAFVLASRSETFGLVYVEALLSGLPVVATRCGGPEDFIDASNGILVDSGDVSQLKSALIDLRSSIECYDRLSISQICQHKFSPERIATLLTNLYEELQTRNE